MILSLLKTRKCGICNSANNKGNTYCSTCGCLLMKTKIKGISKSGKTKINSANYAQASTSHSL